MAYIVPQALVFQDLRLVPAADIQPQPAYISGGHAYLARYSESDEKALSSLGFYDPLSDNCYSWPGRPAGATIDTDYTRLFIDDALLEYFADAIGTGSDISTVAGETNQVRSATLSFKANGSSFPRSATFLDRDVQVGDVAKVRAVVGADTFTTWSYVSGFVAEVVAAVVNNAEADDDNAATQVAPALTFSQTGGPDNCVDITSADQSSYDGLEDGDINETYTITVTESSAGEDATTAKLRVTSASGNDDVAEVTPAAFGSPTAIGTRGLTVTFNLDEGACSVSADNESVSTNDLIVGQEFEVSCGQAFTAPAATSAGTYNGASDTTYIIEVTKGGLYADDPQITVSTTTGIDASGPTTISAASTAVAIGTQGVTVEFDASGLRKGDRYFIAVEAEKDGAIQTLELGHNLPEEVIDNGATEVGLTLYIRKNLEVSENRTGFAPAVNWTQSDTEFCTKSGIIAYDTSWTDNGEMQPLDVVSESTQGYGEMFLEYRAWRSDLCNTIGSIADVSELDDAISGPTHPDNELKWGVFKALSNSNGVPVKFTSVCDPSDSDSWSRVLELADGRRDVYGLVPLTRDKTVWDLFQAHVGSQSSPEFGRWRMAWFNLDGISEKSIVDSSTSSDGEEVLATVSDDPDQSGTQYTLVQVPGGNGQFLENGVRAGDVVRLLYTTDGFGNTTYTERVVDAVINEDSLRLVTGLDAAINVAQKIEIWRNLNATEQASEIAASSGYQDRRVMTVWPDEVGSGGLTFPGYHLCAALAGRASGVVPQRGLTNVEINGFDDISRTTDVFNRSQLNTMAGNGVWIVSQDTDSGAVFTRHAVTTADYENISEREEVITRNLDSMSFFLLDIIAPYIGVSNVTDSLINTLRAELKAGVQALRARNQLPNLGGQLVEGRLTELRAHATLKDRIVASLNLDLPFPLNNLELHLVA